MVALPLLLLGTILYLNTKLIAGEHHQSESVDLEFNTEGEQLNDIIEPSSTTEPTTDEPAVP